MVSVQEEALLIGQQASGLVLALRNHNPQRVRPGFIYPYLLTHPDQPGRGGDDGPSWLDFLTVPPNSVNGIPSIPLHNPQHPHPHPHHPTSFLNQRNFSTGPSLSPSFGGLSQLNLSRFSGSDDSRSGRRPIPRDNTYSPWSSDASSQSGRSDSSMSILRPSQNVFDDRGRRLEMDEGAPGASGGGRGPLP